ncbi:Thymidylate kinase [compost metagenome]
MARASKRSEADRFEREKRAFFERVREGFAYIHTNEPNRFKRIDATLPPAQVLEDAIRLLQPLIKLR